jgi:hypothetical protein
MSVTATETASENAIATETVIEIAKAIRTGTGSVKIIASAGGKSVTVISVSRGITMNGRLPYHYFSD